MLEAEHYRPKLFFTVHSPLMVEVRFLASTLLSSEVLARNASELGWGDPRADLPPEVGGPAKSLLAQPRGRSLTPLLGGTPRVGTGSTGGVPPLSSEVLASRRAANFHLHLARFDIKLVNRPFLHYDLVASPRHRCFYPLTRKARTTHVDTKAIPVRMGLDFIRTTQLPYERRFSDGICLSKGLFGNIFFVLLQPRLVLFKVENTVIADLHKLGRGRVIKNSFADRIKGNTIKAAEEPSCSISRMNKVRVPDLNGNVEAENAGGEFFNTRNGLRLMMLAEGEDTEIECSVSCLSDCDALAVVFNGSNSSRGIFDPLCHDRFISEDFFGDWKSFNINRFKPNGVPRPNLAHLPQICRTDDTKHYEPAETRAITAKNDCFIPSEAHTSD
ncbi:hypothetical protein HG530_011984 [Fusarium avenaceum]|nr:hypothetical protein HG530_011984 [Fusarium avenaceum]